MATIEQPIIATPDGVFSEPVARQPVVTESKRGARSWDAATDSRLNSAHWAPAKGQSVNDDWSSYGETLRKRCEHEARNHPTVRGVINTHKIDVVGAGAYPVLQVECETDSYASALEDIWSEWWEMPDLNGQLSGADLLRQNVGMWWTAGEFLNQIVMDASADTPLKVRALAIHPNRLGTPPTMWGEVTLGVRRSKLGRPLSYWIKNEDATKRYTVGLDYSEIPSDQIVHGFEVEEPGQVRGIPLLASALDSIAEFRDYDAQVLDAARAAADYTILLSTDHPDATYLAVNESTSIERRTISTLPPGWRAQQVDAKQPTTNYIDYRMERQRDIGRGVNMPLMMIRLDSADHNYSSARFDGQLYVRGVSMLQRYLERIALNRFLRSVEVEARVGRLLPERPAGRVRFVWTWPTPPHVDPKKEAEGSEVRLENMMSSLVSECAATGRDFQTVWAQIQREIQQLNALGVLHPAQRGKSVDRALLDAISGVADQSVEDQDNA